VRWMLPLAEPFASMRPIRNGHRRKRVGKDQAGRGMAERADKAAEFRVFSAAASRLEDVPAAPFTMLAALLRKRLGITAGMEDTASQAAFRAELQASSETAGCPTVAGCWASSWVRDAGKPACPVPGHASRTAARHGSGGSGAFPGRGRPQAPLGLVVDDVHLADDASLDVLQCLSAELGEAPIVLVVAARPELFVRRPGG